jgi:hypothetical protein
MNSAARLRQSRCHLKAFLSTNHVLFDEADERRPFDLNGLSRPVVQGDDEVEKVAFPQIGRGLLFEMNPGDADRIWTASREA